MATSIYCRHRTDPRAQLLPRPPEVPRAPRLARSRLQSIPHPDPAATPRYMFWRPRDWVAESEVKMLENKLSVVMSLLQVFLPIGVDSTCPVCGLAEETISQLLFQCNREVLKFSYCFLRSTSDRPDQLEATDRRWKIGGIQNMGELVDGAKGEERYWGWHAMHPLLICWQTWKARSQRMGGSCCG
ncbi:hypothetical protein RHMOL_Rhmol06G0061400 [Rhododendron molle]|uniref:Uncharacterized protein n=1 Tax=Rhododendron molle TaxID=49168 RepID=A0ACC0NAK5_RHOML|nr:hypothetical protein RHMOL_Rhmol06G0061400 [Rhododendron molle]